MAQRFNLTAQLQLQAPANTSQVVSQIRKQLKDIGVDVKVKANTREVAKLNKELQGVSKYSQASAKSVHGLNAALAQASVRFSVITVATGSLLAFTRALKNSVGEAVQFEKELLKISQVTGRTVDRLGNLTSEVTRLATGLGVASGDLLNVSRVLSQAGFSAQKTKQALESLAQTTLAATFDNIQDTTEGAIAVLRQFGDEAKRSGGDIKFLASTLDAINTVSKNFAVESGDLITVIRRVGGVFAAAGGNVNELIALFTSVRATTRESAETIATGLRTIFTRLQRTDTVDQLKELGIELRNAQGQFVGAFEAVRRLSVGLSTLDPRDASFSDIVEELGGFRQVGKVIPLIQQFTTAQLALNAAQDSAGSVARDALIAQKGLGNQITKVKEEFSALIRQFADSSSFRSITTGALELAKAFIRIASALENVLPLITTLVGLKIGQSLGAGVGSLLGRGGAQRRNQGGRIHAFARGGFVPGSGNRDTVPAMLTPGEFVIKKSSADKLGASTLQAMNNNRYAGGGVAKFQSSRPYISSSGTTTTKASGTLFDPKLHRFNKKDAIEFQRTASKKIDVNNLAKLDGRSRLVKAYRDAPNAQIRGAAFEDIAKKELSLNKLAKGSSRLDATGPGGQIYEIKSELGALSDTRLGNKMVGAAINPVPGSSIDSLVQKRMKKNILSRKHEAVNLGRIGVIQDVTTGLGAETKRVKRAKGGGISGSDTVPALLTPGEFVINKSSAQSIGYSNLSKMNQTGVQRFAAGGFVGGVQRFANGGPTGKGFGLSAAPSGFLSVVKDLAAVRAAFEKMKVSGSTLTKVLNDVEKELKDGKSPAQAFDKAFEKLKKTSMESRKAIEAETAAKKRARKAAGKPETKGTGSVPVPGGGGGGGGKIAAVNNLASAAQQFVFLGAIAGSVGAEFTSLEKTTRDAISATAASVATTVGIAGTLVQTFTSIATSGAVQAVASLKSAGADEIESQSSMKAAASNSAFSTVLGGIALGATVAITALEFFKQKAIAEANALAKGVQEAIKKLEEFGGTGAGVADKQIQETAKRQEAQEFGNLDTVYVVIASIIGGLTAFVSVMGAVGTAAAAVTGPVGWLTAGLVLLVGGIAGWVTSLAQGNEAVREGEAVAKQQAAAIRESAAAMADSITALKDFNDAFRDLEERRFPDTAEGRAARISASASITGEQLPGFAAASQKASAQLEALAVGIGKSANSLTAADFEGANAKFKAQFDNITKTLETSNQGLDAALQKAQENFTAALREEGTGERSFEELRAAGGNFAKTFDQLNAALEARFAKERRDIQRSLNDATRIINDTTSSKEEKAQAKAQQKAATEQLKKLDERRGKARENLEKDTKTAIKIQEARITAEKQALAAALELADRFSEFNRLTNDVTKFGRSLDEQGNRIKNVISALTEGTVEITISDIPDLKNVDNIADPDRTKDQIDALIRRAPASQRRGLRDAGETFLSRGKIFGELRDEVLRTQFKEGRTDEEFRKDRGAIAENILGQVAPDIDLGSDLGKEIRDKLIAALSDGVISPQEYAEIFAPLKEEGEKAGNLLNQSNKNAQKELDNYGKHLDGMAILRRRQLQAEEQYINTLASNAELLEKARGEGPNIEQRERFRIRAAQTALRGTGAQAGNVASVQKARERARRRLVEIGNLSPGEREGREKELKRESKKLTESIKQLDNEFKRLGDQAGRASDILSEIDKERDKRETLTGIITDFVVGGRDDRSNLAKAAAGIQLAVRTTTIQNQNPEQRKATIALLDRLGDVEIAGTRGLSGTGELLTAKEFKKGLIFQDAIRLGLDPKIAEQLANSTSKEQELIDALKDLTEQMKLASSIAAIDAGKNAAGLAQGGPVYKSDGGTIFQPKGTDTVPAMLTPGEFVIRKSAVDKIGVGTLQALNSGSTQHFSRGGVVQYFQNPKGPVRRPPGIPLHMPADTHYRDEDGLGLLEGLAQYVPDSFKLGPITETSIFEKNIEKNVKPIANSFMKLLGNISGYNTDVIADAGTQAGRTVDQYANVLAAGSLAMAIPTRAITGDEAFTPSLGKHGEKLTSSDRKKLLQKSKEQRIFLSDKETAESESRFYTQSQHEDPRAGQVTLPPEDPSLSQPGLAPAIGRFLESINPLSLARDEEVEDPERLRMLSEANLSRERMKAMNQAVVDQSKKLNEIKTGGNADKAAKERAQRRAVFLETGSEDDYLEHIGLTGRVSTKPKVKNAGEKTLGELLSISEPETVANLREQFEYKERMAKLIEQNPRLKAMHEKNLQTGERYRKGRRKSDASHQAKRKASLHNEIQDDAATKQGLRPDLVRQRSADLRKSLKAESEKSRQSMRLMNLSSEEWNAMSEEEQDEWLKASRQRDEDALAESQLNQQRQRARERYNRMYRSEEGSGNNAKTAVERKRDRYKELGLRSNFDMQSGDKQEKAMKRRTFRAARNYAFYRKLKQKQLDKRNSKESITSFRDLDKNDRMSWELITPRDTVRKIRAEADEASRLRAAERFGGGRGDTEPDMSNWTEGRKKIYQKKQEQKQGKEKRSLERKQQRRINRLFGRQVDDVAAAAGASASSGELTKDLPRTKGAEDYYATNSFDPNSFADAHYRHHNSFVQIQGEELRTARRILKVLLVGGYGNTTESAKELQTVLGVFQGLRNHALGAFNTSTESLQHIQENPSQYDPLTYKNLLTAHKAKFNHYRNIMRDISSQARVIENSVGIIYSGRAPGARRAQAVFNTAGYLLNRSDGMRELRNQVDVYGKAFYRNQGGGINAADTVPAMLTPGEFVMSKSAVDAHGVGFMKNLNRGTVQGFNSGGYVSNQGVQYKQTGGGVANSNGSSVSLDPSGLSDILNNFIGDFNGGLSTVVERFSTISESLMTLSNTFSNLTMTHQFQGDMTLAFSITNGDAIKNSIAEAISPKIQEIITQELDTRLNKDFRIGQ